MERKHLRLSQMELPESKGTYLLIASVARMKRLQVGSLGDFGIVPGFYCYVGSAFGAGGLRARIGHHLGSSTAPHWHIDYLLQVAEPVEVWCTTASQKLEHHWADLLQRSPRFRVAIPRFGSTDYHRSRSSHLYFSKKLPRFSWFEGQVIEQFENVDVSRYVIS